MSTNLVTQQVSSSGTPASFTVTRTQPNYKTSQPVELPTPYTWPVEGRPDRNLMEELH